MPDRPVTLLFGGDGHSIEGLAEALDSIGVDMLHAEEGSPLPDNLEVAVAFLDATDSIELGVRRVTAIRRAAPMLSIIGILGKDSASDIDRLLNAGADDILLLPFERQDVLIRVRSATRLASLRRESELKDADSQLMFDLTSALASSLDFQDILYTVVQRIAEVVRVDRCSIVLRGGTDTTGYVVASSEDPEVRDLPLELSKYPEVQKVLREGRALVIDVDTDPLLDEVRATIPAGGPATSALFPILHESRAMGVLFLRFLARRQDLTKRELALCQAVANATAVALRNARFVSALREEQERISLAHSEAERKVEALSHYADFFESSADGMLVVDARGNVLYANPRMAALTGLTVAELTTKHLRELVVESERPTLKRLIAGFSRGAYPRGLDLRFHGPFGETIILSVSASSTLKLDRGVLLILRDVTSARETEMELRRTKEFLEALISQSVDAIIASDMQGRIMLFNPAAERILGYRAEELLGKPFIEKLYPPGVARRIMDLLRSPDHGGVGQLEQTRATILTKEGVEVPISMTGGMIYEYGEPRATFGIFTDLRERLAIENNLERMRAELMEREREAIAAQLAGAAAHELNQPLTSIMTAVELLKRKIGIGSSHDSLMNRIVSESERMARIVRKIGRITHYETTTYVGSTRIIDLEKSSESSTEIEAQLRETHQVFPDVGYGEDTDVKFDSAEMLDQVRSDSDWDTEPSPGTDRDGMSIDGATVAASVDVDLPPGDWGMPSAREDEPTRENLLVAGGEELEDEEQTANDFPSLQGGQLEEQASEDEGALARIRTQRDVGGDQGWGDGPRFRDGKGGGEDVSAEMTPDESSADALSEAGGRAVETGGDLEGDLSQTRDDGEPPIFAREAEREGGGETGGVGADAGEGDAVRAEPRESEEEAGEHAGGVDTGGSASSQNGDSAETAQSMRGEGEEHEVES